jgi:hypothetical protein
MLVKDQFKRITWDEIFSYRVTSEGIFKQNELRETKGFFNHSGGKVSSEKQLNLQSNISSFSVDKKTSQQPSESNLFKKKVNKENMGSIPTDNSDTLRKQHLKLVNAVRHVLELANHNYCPELTLPLSQKLLTIVQQNLQRLMTNRKEPFQK